MHAFPSLAVVVLATVTHSACLDSRADDDDTLVNNIIKKNHDTDDQANDVPSTTLDTAERDASDDNTPDLADTLSPSDTDAVLDADRDASQDLVVDVDCPTAVIGVEPGLEVAPQTRLRLTGSQSFGDGGELVAFRWEVDQPAYSQSTFVPSATVADPTFEANVAGVYTFRLYVLDARGNESCVGAQEVVYAVPAARIHVSLTWDTPHDPDQTNTGNNAGADLDLHLIAPGSTNGVDLDQDGFDDGWFDLDHDTFWDNPSPAWSSPDPTNERHPTLTRDDTDGAGPENISFAEPRFATTYTVGVHYWDDHAFGNSLATLRI